MISLFVVVLAVILGVWAYRSEDLFFGCLVGVIAFFVGSIMGAAVVEGVTHNDTESSAYATFSMVQTPLQPIRDDLYVETLSKQGNSMMHSYYRVEGGAWITERSHSTPLIMFDTSPTPTAYMQVTKNQPTYLFGGPFYRLMKNRKVEFHVPLSKTQVINVRGE